MKSDVDGSGSISRDEFAMAMQKLGVELEKHDIDAVVNKADKDGGGELEYWEFVKMLRPPKRKKFVKQDSVADGAGGVPIFAVKHDSGMQLVYGRRSIAAETARLKQTALVEQIEMFRPIDAHNAMHALYVALAAKHMTGSQLYSFFLDLDKDGSGMIDSAEFRHTMQTILNLGLTNPQLDVLSRTLDKDGNGDVCYLELKTALSFDKNEEGRQKRVAIGQASYKRSLQPKELVASKTGQKTPFTKVTPFTPFGGWPQKRAEVPAGGGRYATALEAHRQWYCPGSRLQPLPYSEANPSKGLKSYPQPKIRSRSRHLRKPATPTPYFMKKPPASLSASNFFSGMLGQKSLIERAETAMERSMKQDSALPLPSDGGRQFSSVSNARPESRSYSSSSSSRRAVTRGIGSIGSNTAPLPGKKLRPKSQQRSKSQSVGAGGFNQKMKRASTAPTSISRYEK